MASQVSQYVNQLYEATGHDAREIMINGLTAITEGDFNATTFNGKKENEYLKTTDMTQRIQAMSLAIKKDNKPDEKSENLITTKGIRTVTGPVPFTE